MTTHFPPPPRVTPLQEPSPRSKQSEQSDRAEKALLASVLRYPPALDDVALVLREEDFRQHAHRCYWRGIVDLYQAGKQIDLVTVADRLNQMGLRDELGGYRYLAEIWDSEVSGAAAPQYAGMIKDASILRSLHVAGYQIADAADNPAGPAEQILGEAEKAIFAIAEGGMAGTCVPLAEAVEDSIEAINARTVAGAVSGLLTGIEGLDNLTAGLQAGELIVIAARPSVGKTAMGNALALSVARQGHSVLFCSLEQSRIEIATRMLCAQAGVEGQLIRTGTLNDVETQKLLDARNALTGLPIHIDDSPSQSVLRIAANARRLKRREALSLVIVDYLQLIEPEDRRVPRHEQVGGISRRLKALARDLKVPLVALAQLNRGVEDRAGQQPRLSDLRESGNIEADADTVVLLHRPQDNTGLLDLNVAKQRNGPVGAHTVRFDRGRMRFSEIEEPGMATAPYPGPTPFEERDL